jgi:hypothetical protein
MSYTGVLKAVVGRERPNGADDNSFPSGHASCAFALATVLSEHNGIGVAVPAYATAGLIAWSRLRRDAHWLSDVLAGGAIGYIVGRTAVRENAKPLTGDSAQAAATLTVAARQAMDLQVMPMVGGGRLGLMLSTGF